MEHTEIKKVFSLEQEQKHIIVKGWVVTKRDGKNLSFIELNDGSSNNNIQIIAEANKLDNYAEEVKKLTIGSSIRVEGALVKSPAKGQKYEIQADNVKVYGFADPEKYPLQKKDMTMDYLRGIQHLRPRTRLFSAIFRVRSEVAYALHKFYHEHGFFYVHTPIITASDCEGAGQMFQVTTLDLDRVAKDKKVDYKQDFFEKPAFLTVSGQLQGELFAMAIGKIYTFGPTFRAEKSITYRHAAEFWMNEPEMAFYELDDLMGLEEEFIKYLTKHILDNCKEDMEYIQEKIEPGLIDRLNHILNSEFKHVSYTEAIDVLIKSKQKFEVNVEWGIDMNSEHEKYLTEQHYKCPIIVYNYPKEIKAFYMKQNDDGKTVRGTDVLVPKVGEILGGSQREEDLDKLLNRIKELGLSEEAYSWYLDTRRFGTVPHAGFGLGFERFMMFITGINNIRDITPFPRNYKEIDY
jgi:asparaginyl-tRNA synthetase